MKTAMTLALVLAFGVAGCGQEHREAAKVDKSAIEQAIRDKESGWMSAYNSRDAAALMGQYEDDASTANAGMALIKDAAARKAFLDGVAADPALKVEFASDRIIVAESGDLATSRGHYSFTFTDPATKQLKTETGNYLTVYRKAADGGWKAAEDFVTPGPATAPPPAQ